MKRNLFFINLIILATLFGCKKEPNLSPGNLEQNPFLDSAEQFLKTQLSNDDYAKLDLTSNQLLRYHGKNIGVQIFEKEASHKKYLILEKNSGKYKGNWVDLSGLESSQPTYHKGSVILQSLDRTLKTELMVDNNNEVVQINSNTGNSKTNTQLESGRNSNIETAPKTLPEIVVYYDVYPDGSPIEYSSLYWLFNQDSFYTGLYYESSGNSYYGHEVPGNNSDDVFAAPTFISPEKPIVDLQQEVKCFTNISSSTYSISVNVNEPFPNSRDIFNPFSTFPVGHTFLTLEQHNSDGSAVIRNIGFYPRNGVKPGAAVDKSTFGDDTYTAFDVSLQFKVTGPDFNTVLNTLMNQQGYNYDLNNFNCTNSPMDALNSININLPDTKSADILFTGNDPADLGEDIRNLNLDTFSAANGNRQFTRNVSNSNNQNAPAKTGTCP